MEGNVLRWRPEDAGSARTNGRLRSGSWGSLDPQDHQRSGLGTRPRATDPPTTEDIGRMKKGAILINTSRGPLIDEGALVAAVRAAGGIIAALDVYDKEPLPQDDPLRASGNTVLTPHLGYGVEETWRDFYPRSIENALAFLNGAPIRDLNAS